MSTWTSLLFGFRILPPFSNFPPSSYGLSLLDCTLLILFGYFLAKYYRNRNIEFKDCSTLLRSRYSSKLLLSWLKGLKKLDDYSLSLFYSVKAVNLGTYCT